MKRIIAVMASIVLFGGSINAQDIHASQFYETSILRNPALTGVFAGDYKVGVTYKSQWSSISNPFETAVISVETRFRVNEDVHDFISFGLLSFYDRAGSVSLQTLSVYPAINYNKIINDDNSTYLSVGFTGGMLQRSYDQTKATYNNQYQNNVFSADNPSGEPGNNSSFTHFDLGAGVSFSTNTGMNNQTNYFIGVSGYHFTKPRQTFMNIPDSRLGLKINVNGGLTAPLSKNSSVQAYVNYSQQGSYTEIIGGALLGWNLARQQNEEVPFAVYGGAFYRLNDAIIPTVKVKFNSFTVGFSYDVNLSKLRTSSNFRGGYEITLFKSGLFRNPKFERGRTICPTAI